MKFNKLLKESQFHGGRRLADGNCRCYWYISMILLFNLTVAVICLTVWRYFENPTYMALVETATNQSQFPSVIVCPEIFYRPDKVDRFLSHVQIPPNLNVTYLKDVIYMLAAFYSPDIIYRHHDLENIEELLDYNNMSVNTAARLLTSSCTSSLIKCRWHGDMVNCSSLFEMELTGDGFCCVFNGRSLAREVFDGLRREKYEYKNYYTDTYGFQSGLMLAVNQSQSLLSIDLSYKWLALQSSQHYVENSINGSALNPGSEQWVEYRETFIQIAEDARSLSDSLRRCRMADEPLKFFSVYNMQYCTVECEIANTLRRCGCVRMVHPQPQHAPYCKAHQLLCAYQARVSVGSKLCLCPMTCDVSESRTTTTSFHLQPHVVPTDTFYAGLNYSTVTVVRVFLMNNLKKTLSRRSYFTNFYLFSQLGGMFNLFLGCSMLTLIELAFLVYHGVSDKIRARQNTAVQSLQKREGKKNDKKEGNIRLKGKNTK